MPPKKKSKLNDCDCNERFQKLAADDPVLIVQRDVGDAPVLDIASDSLFADMIDPISPKVFMEQCFRRKALHVTGCGPARVEPIMNAMDMLDPASILRETSSDNVFVWILDKQQRKIQSVEIDSVDTAIALHKAGHATYCRAPPNVEQPMVANMLRGTGMGCGNYDPSGNSSICMGRGEVEVFMGTLQHTTDWHFDFQENFTLQLSGVKKWTLQQGTVKYPLRGCTPHYKAPDVVESQLKAAHLGDLNFQFGVPQVGVNAVGKVVEVVVNSGDMLFFPAGMWHKVETVEPGVSINVSLMATNYAALVSQALHHYLLTKDEWRESVATGPTSMADNTTCHLNALLRQLPSEIEKLTNQMNFTGQILPPILLAPPKLELVRDEEDVAHGSGDEMEEELEEAIEENGDTIVDKEKESYEIVDINKFERPEEAPLIRCPTFDCSGKLIVSKLASLLKMSDITSFYCGNNKENEMSPLYVLNINFAGNEMHESTVRVVLTDSNGHLDSLIDGKPREPIACPDGVREPWHECLLYYGFFVWLPNISSSG